MKTKHLVWILIVACLTVFTANMAYSRKSSGFSGSSFKSGGSSFKFSSNSGKSKPPVATYKPKTTTSTYKPSNTTTYNTNSTNTYKPSNTPTTVTKSTFGSTKENVITQRQKIAASKDAYREQQQQFKIRDIPTTKVGSTSTSSYTWSKPTIKVNPSNRSTYYERRSRMYDNWNVPTYSYNSYSNFGAWDSMALWFMLSQASTNAMYANMFYHQANDPGFKEWRTEANKLAETNAELKDQLAKLDKQTASLKNSGVKVDPTYTPSGIDSDVLLSTESLKKMAPELRVCTGNPTKTYNKVGGVLANNLESVNVKLIPTGGSIDNLKKLDNHECDAALVQRDSYIAHVNQTNGETSLNYTRVLSPYSEVVHLICTTKSNIKNVSDLYDRSKITVAIGSEGSGNAVTWNNLVRANEQFATVKTTNIDGSEVINQLNSDKVDCIFNISGINNTFMQAVNGVSLKHPMELVEWDDDSLDETLDPALEPVYHHHTLDPLYRNLQLDNVFGYFNVSTEVITVPADIVVSKQWSAANASSFDALSTELVAINSKIQQAAR